MCVAETHYILLIHGTWSAPENEIRWYQKNGTFANALSDALKDTTLANAVWKDCRGEPTEYFWTGENTHAARIAAAHKLKDRMLSIRVGDSSARIHLIGHSHGGNIILKALELYVRSLTDETAALAKI